MFIDEKAARFEAFVAGVMQHMQTSSPLEALEAIRATFSTIGDCLNGAEADDIANELPFALASYLYRSDWQVGERLTADEFVARLAGREDVCKSLAWQHLSAVLLTAGGFGIPSDGLRVRLDPDLPPEIATLWSACRGPVQMVRMHQPIAG